MLDQLFCGGFEFGLCAFEEESHLGRTGTQLFLEFGSAQSGFGYTEFLPRRWRIA
jgi:hypothetical protein